MVNQILLVLLQIMVAVYNTYSLQNHIVGDSIWSIPPTYDFYGNWSSSYSFHIGDTLYFDFDSGLYNVIQVSRGEFDSCSGNQPLDALMYGPATFPLSRKGVFYFMCNVSNYCWLGQKVSVIVDEEEEEEEEEKSAPLASPSPSPR
ncbi:hypothetical protein CASFOL_018337 [Castilleja foliolosa]|uniref:Phytocyanin domain-containing protein n=1 Tax=Castilleja foliolosa TaxID=1961234 RepID=A0ABD3D7U0_9LAMI